jgi:transposase
MFAQRTPVVLGDGGSVFRQRRNYAEYHDDPAISVAAVAAIYGVDVALVKRWINRRAAKTTGSVVKINLMSQSGVPK